MSRHGHSVLKGLAIALIAFSVACGGDAPSGDECPDGQVLVGANCVDRSIGVDGCTDPDASNFDEQASEDDGSCTYAVTFEVDMSDVSFDPVDGVSVRGTFRSVLKGSNAFDASLTDTGTDDIWSVTIDLAPGIYEYVYAIEGAMQEETVPRGCDAAGAFDPATGARFLMVSTEAQTLGTVPFGGCPAVPLPFAVDDKYVPTGFIGDSDTIDVSNSCEQRAGNEETRCHRFTYVPGAESFAGVLWQFPANNFGDQPGFEIPQGATEVAFTAWGETGGEAVNFVVGIADVDGFHVETGDIALSTTPREYSVLLLGVEYTDVVSAFGWTAAAPAGGGNLVFSVEGIEWRDTAITDLPGCTDQDALNYDSTATVDDGSCEYNVTFQVDMSDVVVDGSDVVYLQGDFNGFCGLCAPMSDDNDDGIWTLVIPLDPGNYEYKYTINGFDGVVETVPQECDVVEDPAFDNRGFTLGPADLILELVPFGECEPPGDEVMVFDDDYGPNVTFAPFGGSINVLTIDTNEARLGTASLRVDVPAAGYTGGAFVADPARNVSSYDAVAFWAKADAAHTLNVVGIGDDAEDTTFKTEIGGGISLTTDWANFTIPLPDPSVLTASTGLFHFAEGSEEGAYTIWLDEIRYVNLEPGTVTNPRPAIASQTQMRSVGDTFTVAGTSVVYAIDGSDLTLAPCAPPFFAYTSSDEDVATVDDLGVVTARDTGIAEITAELMGTPAAGTLTVEVSASLGPDVAAPIPPARDAADVISLFSGAYSDVTVDTFRTDWSSGSSVLTDEMVAGDAVKKYAEMTFVGIEFATAPIDATGMTHFHIDVWIEGDEVTDQKWGIKLVDFGADGLEGGGDDSEAEIDYTPSGAPSPPPLDTGRWDSYDIPLTDFEPGGEFDAGPGLASRAGLAQLILVSVKPGDTPTSVWVDNIYFYADDSGGDCGVEQSSSTFDLAGNVTVSPMSGPSGTMVVVDVPVTEGAREVFANFSITSISATIGGGFSPTNGAETVTIVFDALPQQGDPLGNYPGTVEIVGTNPNMSVFYTTTDDVQAVEGVTRNGNEFTDPIAVPNCFPFFFNLSQ